MPPAKQEQSVAAESAKGSVATEKKEGKRPRMESSDMFFMAVMLPLFVFTCVCMYKIMGAIHDQRNNIEQYFGHLQTFKFEGVEVVTKEILIQKFAEHRWPYWSDFTVTILSAFVLCLCDKLINWLTLDFFIQSLDPKKRIDAETDRKYGRKKTSSLFKFIYCIFVTIQGYFAMRDMDVFPPYFFGRNPNYKVQNMYKNWPLLEFPVGLKFYYTFVLGYHVYKTYDDLTTTNKMNDFFELMYHHVLTILLMVGSYMCGCSGQGCLHSYVLDYADMVGCLFRIFGDFKYSWAKYAQIVVGLSFNVSWVIYRVIIYAYFIHSGYLAGSAPDAIVGADSRWIHVYLIAMSWLLYLIILFWWYKIQRIVIMYFVKGKLNDTFSKVEGDKKKDA